MRDLTDGQERVGVLGRTVGEALANLEALHPGVCERLCQDGDVRPFLAVVVDGEVSSMRMYQPLLDLSEVHFLPLLEGG
jgi:hypothetical protein